MSQTKISVHPQIKKIIQNLDLDLGLELSRYEHSRLYDSTLIPQLYTNDDTLYANTFSPNLVDQSALIKKDELEEEIISPTSHSINEQTSILDKILTPWGIFGIIIFFAANLFIFLNLEDNQSPSKVSNSNQNLANTVNSQANPPEDNNNPQASPQAEKPTIPNTLPVVQETSDINISSPYPDLKTALFTEINKQKSSLTKSSAEQKATSSTPTKSSQPTRPISPSSKSDKENQTPTKYYVISNYKNMDEFTRIKKIEPSAFITKIDQQIKIQLAIVENEKEAKKKSQQLKDRGIDNYLYNNSSNAEPGT